MPNKKQLQQLPRTKKTAAKLKGPDTANEYLAAGVDLEEAGGKWRAGDAAKSARFFLRAIENYDAGLQKFPRSFDLAYNKARLQYEVAQQPRLLAHLSASSIDLLQVAIDSHKTALDIDQDNADLLFNTAQALTSLAEATSEGRAATDATRKAAVRMLQEALELFQRCLEVQEFQFTESEKQASRPVEPATPDQNDDIDMVPSSPSDPSDGERWATVVELVSKDTLVDTAIAQLGTLTALCTVLGSQGTPGLGWIEEYHRSAIRDKLSAYSNPANPTQHHEIALTNANFASAFSNAAFRAGQLDLQTYDYDLGAAFTQAPSLASDPQALCDRAEADLAFHDSVCAALPTLLQTHPQHSLSALRWIHLSAALDGLTAASQLPRVQHLQRIDLRRGDCELLRRRLADAPAFYDLAVDCAVTLLKNAAGHYSHAVELAGREATAEEAGEARVKEAVVGGLRGDSKRLQVLMRREGDGVTEVVEQMVEEALLGGEEARVVWGFVGGKKGSDE